MSNNYGEPDWATPGATAAPVTTTQDALSGGAITAPTGEPRDNSKMLIILLSFVDMGLAGLMGALGVLSIIDFNPSSTDDYAEVFLSVYMIIFAVLLLVYELMWWKGIPFINRNLRKNFGFLYGLKGKGFYLIFVAFLTLGLRDQTSLETMALATGIAFLAAGVIHIFLICTKPEMVEAYRAPTSGLTTSTDNGSAPV